jgi:diacylglycerol kinase family enzyme
VRKGELEKVRGVHVWRDVNKITVEAEPEEAIQADGELLGRSGLIVISRAHDELNVIVPGPEG